MLTYMYDPVNHQSCCTSLIYFGFCGTTERNVNAPWTHKHTHTHGHTHVNSTGPTLSEGPDNTQCHREPFSL